MLKKRAQAAMEFLMTYGWAILVVLIVVGALAFFGVLNPKNLLPERCTFGVGLQCEDYQVTSTGEVKFKLSNGFDNTITVTELKVWTLPDNNPATSPNAPNCDIKFGYTVAGVPPRAGIEMKSGVKGVVGFMDTAFPETGAAAWTASSPNKPSEKCSGLLVSKGEKTKFAVHLTYYEGSNTATAATQGFPHTVTGELLANVE